MTNERCLSKHSRRRRVVKGDTAVLGDLDRLVQDAGESVRLQERQDFAVIPMVNQNSSAKCEGENASLAKRVLLEEAGNIASQDEQGDGEVVADDGILVLVLVYRSEADDPI